MLHLLRSELMRFRTLAFSFALGHLVLLAVVDSAADLLAPDALRLALSTALYAVLGLAFGLVQMRSRARSEQWIYLLHRPLEPRGIFAALATAAALCALLVIGLPLLLMILKLDVLGAQWVDLRHYGLPFFAVGVSLAFYFGGCFIALSPSRAAFLVLVLPLFFLTRQADGLWIYAVQAVVLCWLALLAASAFQPDVSLLPCRPAVLAAATAPVAYAAFWALAIGIHLSWSLGTIFIEHGPRGLSTFAWNDYFPEGTMPHVDYLDGTRALMHALAAEDTEPRLVSLRDQLELADVLELRGLDLQRGQLVHAARHQPLFADRGASLVDADRAVRWSFSHDRMLFHGLSMRTGESVGWLGASGDRATSPSELLRFASVPTAVSPRHLATPRRLYELRRDGDGLALRSELPDGERWASALITHRGLTLARSDRALYLFDARTLERERGVVAPRARVPLPGGTDNLSRVDIAELLDGHLLAFTFGRLSERERYPAYQSVVEVGVDGVVTPLVERSLGPGPPAWVRHRGFLVSPTIQQAHDLTWSLLAPQRPGRIGLTDIANAPPPRLVLLALLAAMASAAATAMVASRRGLDRAARRMWTVVAFALGAPGFFAFLAWTRRRETVDAPASRRSDAASAPRRLALVSWSSQ
ncbi:MAG: hypothetical protein AAGC60_12455 [Acidobacteriota bacterium]